MTGAIILLFVVCCINISHAWQFHQNRVITPIKQKWLSIRKSQDSLGSNSYLLRPGKWMSMSSVDVSQDSIVNSISSKISSGQPLPTHPQLVTGKLENGFTYYILPNNNPPGRFEAHLEVMSGSANELENQQGMAHLLEHVAYMGSPKRQLISGTGSRTNAYTDFHHTVFFAACPTETPDQFWKKPMLPLALDALLDVMTTKVEDDRLEKERSAVLSEASMVNKMDYRVECQILSTLHKENRISQRFPIGKESLIKNWKKEDLELYHSLHYRPDNVVLFIVGDVDVAFAQEQIKKKFASLQPKIDAQKIFSESNEFPRISMRDVNRHFPPVVHKWSAKESDIAPLVPESLLRPLAINDINKNATTADMLAQNTNIFQHELLQSFSFHVFAKRPIEQVTTTESFKRELMRRIVLTTLQIRLNVQQRKEPLFTFADFNQMNWPREGCAVCSLDIVTDTKTWKDAVSLAVKEVRRLGLFGLTQGELHRYKQAIYTEAAQHAAEAEQKSSEDLVTELMTADACGHTYIHPKDILQVTEEALSQITLEDVNGQCLALCEHLSHMDGEQGVQPAAIVACAPAIDRQGHSFNVSEAELIEVLTTALAEPLQPLQDTPVPTSLLSEEIMQEKMKSTQPRFVPLTGKALKDETATTVSQKTSLMGGLIGGMQQVISGKTHVKQASGATGGHTGGVTQRKLNNGIRVNMKPLDTETQRVAIRMYVPGGRIVEDVSLPGAVLIGARTMQEGGAFKHMSREQVEMFCIDHNVMVEINAGMDAVTFDFSSVTTKSSQEMSAVQSSSDQVVDKTAEVSGAEALLQVMHVILTDFVFEQDAFERALQAYHEEFDSTVKNLESACQEAVTYSITGADPRFLMPNHLYLADLTLPKVEEKMRRLLRPENIEVSIAGDMSLESMEQLVLKYLGSIPASERDKSTGNLSPQVVAAQKGEVLTPEARLLASVSPSFLAGNRHVGEPLDTISPKPVGKSSNLAVYLPDSEERAMGYLAGPAPNRFGYGQPFQQRLLETISNNKNDEANDNKNSKNTNHNHHPLHTYATLMIVQEVINRRLFSVVREERRLTYDASFQWVHHDGIHNGWYLISVTASPTTVKPAIRACQEALQSLSGVFGVMGDSIQSAKRTLLTKHRTDSQSNRYWVDMLSGTQSDHIQGKTLRSMMDWESVLQSVTVQDVQAVIEAMDFSEDNMTTCIGVAAPALPDHLKPQDAERAETPEHHLQHSESTALN